MSHLARSSASPRHLLRDGASGHLLTPRFDHPVVISGIGSHKRLVNLNYGISATKEDLGYSHEFRFQISADTIASDLLSGFSSSWSDSTPTGISFHGPISTTYEGILIYTLAPSFGLRAMDYVFAYRDNYHALRIGDAHLDSITLSLSTSTSWSILPFAIGYRFFNTDPPGNTYPAPSSYPTASDFDGVISVPQGTLSLSVPCPSSTARGMRLLPFIPNFALPEDANLLSAIPPDYEEVDTHAINASLSISSVDVSGSIYT